jgi:shikimate 5-dehydrogenase
LKSATSAPISQYHLLVNCTPRGTSTTSLQQEMLPKFTKLIDLPYQKKPTELVQFCQQNSLQFVSGQQFWYWQAEEQLKYFIKQLKGKL